MPKVNITEADIHKIINFVFDCLDEGTFAEDVFEKFLRKTFNMEMAYIEKRDEQNNTH